VRASPGKGSGPGVGIGNPDRVDPGGGILAARDPTTDGATVEKADHGRRFLAV
jgi:hypothetical protein